MSASRRTISSLRSAASGTSRGRSAARLSAMADSEKIRLGGMALANGVLVHGPNSWACAIRTPTGELQVASGYKRLRGSRVRFAFLRGPARLAEVFALMAELKRRLPAARLPFQRPGVLAAMAGSAVAVRGVKGSTRLSPLARELIGSLLSLAPAALAVRSSELAAYHGAEHISIGSYEHGERRAREHERCGSHMLRPLMASAAIGGGGGRRAARPPRVLMQVFQKKHSYLGGIDEAIAILKLCADDWDGLTVHALYDGGQLEPYEPVLTIEGDYTGFAHLETLYLGVLARRTLITTNVVCVLQAANRKPIIV